MTYGPQREHALLHVATNPAHLGGSDPKEFTGMVDLTRDRNSNTRARLLDLVPDHSGQAYKDWGDARREAFRTGIKVALFHGYKNAIAASPAASAPPTTITSACSSPAADSNFAPTLKYREPV